MRRRSSSAARERWTSTRRVVVQRWPAVPTAPKTIAGTARFRFGALIDDDRVVAAELEQALAETLGDAHADLAADVRRARERHERDAPIIDESARELGAGVDENLEDRGQGVPLEHAVADVLHGERTQRGLRRGFPHRRVAADGGEERVPGPHRHRKIEGRDHADDAERMPLLVHAVLGALGMHRQAVQHARLADREIGDVDHFLHFPVALGLDLAVLQGHETAERVLVQAKLLGEQADGLAALGRRHRAPACAPPRPRECRTCS